MQSKTPFASRVSPWTLPPPTHPGGLRRDKPPPGIRDCLDLYARIDVGRGRALSAHRPRSRIDRSILRQTVNIADELVQPASTGISGRGGGLGCLPCDLSSGRNPLPFDVGYFPADFHPPIVLHTFFLATFYVFFSPDTEETRASIASRPTSGNNDWLALVVPRF